MLDLAVIGAGPCGLAVGVAAKRAHLACSLFDKGPVVSSLQRYPLYMTFFSTPEKLEIGDRKSTRLNSSHSQISYAVFCLKKKKKTQNSYPRPPYIPRPPRSTKAPWSIP